MLGSQGSGPGSDNWRNREVARDGQTAPFQPPSHRSPWVERNQRETVRRERKEWKAREEPARALAEETRIYVGNMPYTAQKKDVEALFEASGIDVVNIDMSIDPFTNRNPSYCFVDLATQDAATSAIDTLTGKELLGRPLKVRPCVQKRRQDTRTHTQSDGLIFTRWRDSRPSPGNAGSSHPDPASPTQQKRRVFLGGLPKPVDQHTSDLEIRALFESFEVKAVSKVKSPLDSTSHINNGNQWYAFVDFSTEEEAKRAVAQLDGTKKWGGTLSVRWAKTKQRQASSC